MEHLNWKNWGEELEELGRTEKDFGRDKRKTSNEDKGFLSGDSISQSGGTVGMEDGGGGERKDIYEEKIFMKKRRRRSNNSQKRSQAVGILLCLTPAAQTMQRCPKPDKSN